MSSAIVAVSRSLAMAALLVVPSAQAPNPDAQALAELDKRIAAYLAIHQKHEDSLPQLSKEATPEQINTHQRRLATLIQKTRANAQVGDIFTRESRAFIRRVLARVFGGPSGAQMKASIMDENPGPLRLRVNGRYPDAIPLTSVPPEVIKALPHLPEELEFRFIGQRLILLDVHAHTIVDYVEDALPK
jgi:hypothetical protein